MMAAYSPLAAAPQRGRRRMRRADPADLRAAAAACNEAPHPTSPTRSRSEPMPTLVLLRHGQSQWNLEDRFTGWVDVDLSAQGEAEARRGGELIAEAGLQFDRCFASVLTRAIRTADLALAAAGQLWIPIEKHWRLNERHYGGLTGLNKAETAAKDGAERVREWRRSYDIPPPPLAPGGPYDFAHDRRYAGVAAPAAETLKSTLERVQPYWDSEIAARLNAGERLLIAAHGNSLRAIVKLLFAVSDSDIPGVEIPTGNPLLIALDSALRPTAARYLDERRAQAIPASA
jgi:2,3-bisphosphoglycerate-dependent phosphoglycerate mutase